ncbi:MAG: lipopolysaccharide biosynthesis protein [Microthrixaceae bacterium]
MAEDGERAGAADAMVDRELVQPLSETSGVLAPDGLLQQELLSEAAVDVAERAPGSAGVEPGLGTKVRRGAVWSAGSVVVMRFANIALMAVVARLVAPAEFGLFTVALTVHAFVTSVAELGVASAVARSDLDIDRIAPTVATISIVTSFTLGALMFGFAQNLADLMGSPDAAAPLRVLSLTVVMIGPFAVPGAQLQREFRQQRLFLASVVSFVVSSGVLMVLALNSDGAMAFAWSRVVGTAITGWFLVTGVSKHYWPGFRRSEVSPLLRFGLPLAGANLLSQLLLNVDYVFVSRISGAAKLGLYTLAFNIASWPTAVIGSMLNGVVLPAFSAVKQTDGALGPAMHKATRSVLAVAAPIGFTTLALATPLVATVYGAKWLDAAPVLQILSLYGVIFVTCVLFANIIIAMGRTGVLMIVQVVALAALVPTIALGLHRLGLVGVGVAHIVVICAVTLPTYLVAVRRTTRATPLLLARAAGPPVLAAAVAALAAAAVSSLTSAAPLQLVTGGVAAVAVYGLLMLPFLEELAPPALLRVPVAARLVHLGSSVRSRLSAP